MKSQHVVRRGLRFCRCKITKRAVLKIRILGRHGARSVMQHDKFFYRLPLFLEESKSWGAVGRDCVSAKSQTLVGSLFKSQSIGSPLGRDLLLAWKAFVYLGLGSLGNSWLGAAEAWRWTVTEPRRLHGEIISKSQTMVRRGARSCEYKQF